MASAPVLFSVIEPEDRKVPCTSTKLAVTAKLDDFIRTVVAEIRRLSTRPEVLRDLLDCASVYSGEPYSVGGRIDVSLLGPRIGVFGWADVCKSTSATLITAHFSQCPVVDLGPSPL